MEQINRASIPRRPNSGLGQLQDQAERKIMINFRNSNYLFPQKLLNRYKIGKVIDSGGFGAVFDCLDESSCTMHVIKIVSLIEPSLLE